MKIQTYCLTLMSTLTFASQAAQIAIPGVADIYGAGHANTAGTGGSLPPEFDFTAGSGLILTVTNVTGSVTLDLANKPFNDADGGSSYTMTAITSYGGISGISHDSRTMFLVGVFLDATEPVDPAPASLSYTAATTGGLTYSPLLRQTFFIGDGLTGTGSGSIQQFIVPAGASRLFLGFADGFSNGTISGPPSFYGDNSGTLSAYVQVASVPSTCPTLSITGQPNVVAISWPSTGSNAILESASSLTAGDWAPVNTTPVIVGNSFVVTNAITSSQMFYRLSCQ